MRYLLTICCLSVPSIFFAQKMLRSGEWCAEGRKQAASFPPSAQDTRSDSLDILHADIQLDISNAPQITGRCSIFLTPKVNGVPAAQLDLQGLTVDSVLLNSAPVAFSHIGSLLTANFPVAPALGDTLLLQIDYHGIPPADASGWGGVYSQSGYTFNLGVGFAADPHSFGRAWFPCFDNFVERSSFDITVTSGVAKPAYCNGLLQSETQQSGLLTRHWKIEQPIPSYLACFAAGPYVSWKKNYDSIPVEIACVAADTNKVKSTFQHLPEAIQCFQHWYGPYKWPKIGYSLVPFNSGAMEHATNVAIGRSYIDGTLEYESLWAHELSHHWWGDLATCSTAEDMWLNEGWAVFSEHLFTEWAYGEKFYRDIVRSNFLQVLENAHVEEGGYRAVSGLPHEFTYGGHTYGKGAVVAHNLRSYLSDSLFRVGIRAALEQTSFDDWSSAELRDKLAAATGQDLTDFFEDWVFGPGFPHFSIDSFRFEFPAIDTFVICRVFVKQKRRGTPHFFQNVPLEFTFVDENWQRQTQRAIVGGQNSTAVFHFPLSSFVPKFIWLNTNLKLTLARADEEKVLKTTGTQGFDLAKINMNVTALPDSALVRVEYHYAMPDTAGTANPHGYHLTNRYWTVDGDFPDGFDASATIFYDGQGQLDQLDTELFAQTGPKEDSIRLLYRLAPGHAWAEYPTYFKNMLGSTTDRRGILRADHLRPGQYTVGKGAATVAVHQAAEKAVFATAAPNPANRVVRLTCEEAFYRILIFSEKGETLREWSVAPTSSLEVGVTEFPAGRYWFVLFTEKGVAFCPVVVAK